MLIRNRPLHPNTEWNVSSLGFPLCSGLYQLYLLFDVITANMQDQEVVTQVADGHTCGKKESPLKL